MNINQLKAFLGDKPQHLGDENSIQNQMRDEGLRQAISGQSSLSSLNNDTFSSSNALGVKIYSNALNNSLEVNRHKPNFSVPETEESQESLFDFTEVAKNVLNFVGGAIKNAKNNGADDDELNQLFEQATSGVLKGIELAEQDLAGFMNEDIADGISQSKSLIEQGIENLKNKIFNDDPAQEAVEGKALETSTDISYVKQQQGELYIRTKDGDQVRLTFDDVQQLEVSQKEIDQATKPEVVETTPAPQQSDVENADSEPEEVIDETEIEDQVSPAINAEQASSVLTEQKVAYYQDTALSFSVQGELDEEELAAIGQLVADTNELAEDFFNGDIEAAFNQALELGFDEQELAGFALQLTKVENTQVIKAYETVSRYDDENTQSEPAKAVTPVADYLDKLLNVLDGSRLQLEDSKSYENVVNELINRLGDDVATPDLISAIHRFNEFNQKLVDNLPIGYQPPS